MITVVEYDPGWPAAFVAVRAIIAPAVAGLCRSIEHVGSTSVPGLAAKPIIDIDVVVDSVEAVMPVVAALQAIGYVHLGNLGIAGREALRLQLTPIAHNLYVCPAGSLGLRNHLAVRDHLRAHADTAAAYGQLKLDLASQVSDIDEYVEQKSALILAILQVEGFSSDELAEIEAANRQPG